VPLVRRWNRGTNTMADDFPYRSHGQPITAWLSLAACLFILVIANGASLWKEFNIAPFLSAYLAVSLTYLSILFFHANSVIANLLPRPLGIPESRAKRPVAARRFVEWR